MSRRISQQDIAERLGLDKSTVSLALRHSPKICQATREEVARVAKEMGYRPDAALSFLAHQRWAGRSESSGSALAYLVDSRCKNFSVHARFLDSAGERAEARGFILKRFDLANYPSISAATRVLNHRGIRGLLVPQFTFGKGAADLNDALHDFTVVGMDIAFDFPPLSSGGPRCVSRGPDGLAASD